MQEIFEPVFVERFGNLFCKQTTLQEKGKKKNLNGGGRIKNEGRNN